MPRNENVSRLRLGQWFDQARQAEVAGDHQAALDIYNKIIVHAPTVVQVILGQGTAYFGLDRHVEALRAFDEAITLDPRNAEAHYSRGTALQSLGKLEEALDTYEKALAFDQLHERATNNRAVILRELGRYDDALAVYQAGTTRWPNSPAFHIGRACMLLQRGDLAHGWPEYEWRQPLLKAKSNGAPIWRGEALQGKRLWIQAEQGLGDTLHFCRYALLAKERGAEVILHVQPRLVRLLRNSLDDILIDSLADHPPASDFQSLLLSMPGGAATRLETIPFPQGYLRVSQDLVTKWKTQLGDSGLRIGIAWQGEGTWQGKKIQRDVGRSIPLAEFSLLSSMSGVRLISLQQNEGVEQLSTMPDVMKVETLEGLDQAADGFLDSAAVMTCCNLVITSDTAVAHLAGGLGVPVWLVLQKVPEWRWLLERTDSPWYTSMRLFRQRSRGDWRSAFDSIKGELEKFKVNQSG
jgi:tetratricopeptide (TPR) repeat protein